MWTLTPLQSDLLEDGILSLPAVQSIVTRVTQEVRAAEQRHGIRVAAAFAALVALAGGPSAGGGGVGPGGGSGPDADSGGGSEPGADSGGGSEPRRRQRRRQ